MKLSSIDAVNNRAMQIRAICGGPIIISEAVDNKIPLSYLFIKSAADILNEAEGGRLESLLKAGMAKIKAAMTPSNAEDLDILLSFHAPGKGGVKAVNDLIAQASKTPYDITSDMNWWNNMFDVFGVQDNTIRNNIIQSVKDEIGISQPSTPTQEQPQSSEAPQTPQVQQQTSPNSQTLSALQTERGSEQNNQNDILSQLAEIRKQREANRAEITKLRNQLNSMTPNGRKFAESICNEIAQSLINEYTVQANLKYICNNVVSTSLRPYSYSIQETGLRDRLRNIFKHARNFTANPVYFKNRLNSVTNSANNQRAAKLAVQALTDNIRTNFNTRMQENGMTPEQIQAKLEMWMSLKAAYENNDTRPEVIDSLASASNEINRIAGILQPTQQVQNQQGVIPSTITPQQTYNPANSEQFTSEYEQKKELLRNIYSTIYRAGINAGRESGNVNATDKYNIIVAAAKKTAMQYAKQHPDATKAVYRYFISQLKNSYRNSYGNQNESLENNSNIITEDDDIFSYDTVADDMWANKIKEAREKFSVSFDTENDEFVDQEKTIKIGNGDGLTEFACKMYGAGGDWEAPLRYFRCQLKKGHAEGLSIYGDSHFVFIPNGEEGNSQLIKSDKNKWVCPDADSDVDKPNDKKCWESLNDYLHKLVDSI